MEEKQTVRATGCRAENGKMETENCHFEANAMLFQTLNAPP